MRKFLTGLLCVFAAVVAEAVTISITPSNVGEHRTLQNGNTYMFAEDVEFAARLKPGVTTNVTAHGCAPGFYYSLRGSGSLEGLGGVESFAVYGPKLCGADAKVVFPEVKKPSEPAGFFKVGVGVTDNVGK